MEYIDAVESLPCLDYLTCCGGRVLPCCSTMAPTAIESCSFRTLGGTWLLTSELQRFYIVVEGIMMSEFFDAMGHLPQRHRVQMRLCGEATVDSDPVVAYC